MPLLPVPFTCRNANLKIFNCLLRTKKPNLVFLFAIISDYSAMARRRNKRLIEQAKRLNKLDPATMV